MTIASIVNLLFKSALGAVLAIGGSYIAIEEQHKANADWRVELAGLAIALLGIFTAPYAGDALSAGGKKGGAFGRRLYDQFGAAKRGDPITDEITIPPTVQVTVNEAKK